MLRNLFILIFLLPTLVQAIDIRDGFFEVYYDDIRTQAGHTIQGIPGGCVPALEDKECMSKVDELTAYFMSRALELKEPSLKTLPECVNRTQRETSNCEAVRTYIDNLTADYLKFKQNKSSSINTRFTFISEKMLPAVSQKFETFVAGQEECDANCQIAVDYLNGYYLGFMYKNIASYTPQEMAELEKCVDAEDVSSSCQQSLKQTIELQERFNFLMNFAIKRRSEAARK